MANTDEQADASAPVRLEPLRADDLAGALALSASAHWNQCEADWRMLLTLGRGWGIHALDNQGRRCLAASIIVLPHGDRVAWVSMVLVLPEFQRRGFAAQLLRHALSALTSKGMLGLLDATPAGHAVYLQEGLRDTWGFARYRREGSVDGSAQIDRPACSATRPLYEADWPAIAALDAPAFGADRIGLLRSLALRLPQAARVLEQGGRLRGFVLGRDGREASQIGPLVAADLAVANALLADALRELPGPVYVDLLDSRRALLPWLQQQGFVFQRPFTRMVHGALDAPGDAAQVVLAAGPELG